MLLHFTPHSIHCPQANIHIDPWEPVDYAIVTHAHSDHATPGCRHYLAHKDSESLLRLRLGEDISVTTVAYNEKFVINGVEFSLHPAGHVIGSAQVKVEHKGDVWVVSGDYKTENDGFCEGFEPVRCNTFITESTFGLPIYKWQPQSKVMEEITTWWQRNLDQDKASVLMGYALGKMQRIINSLQPFNHPVFAHGAIFNVNERLRKAGCDLPYIPMVTNEVDKKLYRKALILATPSSLHSSWLSRFEPYVTGYCSGWMSVRGAKNNRAVDRGFVLSDHADWSGLNSTVRETGAEKIYVTHGYTDVYARWLNEQGINAEEVSTKYGTEEEVAKEGNII